MKKKGDARMHETCKDENEMKEGKKVKKNVERERERGYQFYMIFMNDLIS